MLKYHICHLLSNDLGECVCVHACAYMCLCVCLEREKNSKMLKMRGFRLMVYGNLLYYSYGYSVSLTVFKIKVSVKVPKNKIHFKTNG